MGAHLFLLLYHGIKGVFLAILDYEKMVVVENFAGSGVWGVVADDADGGG